MIISLLHDVILFPFRGIVFPVPVFFFISPCSTDNERTSGSRLNTTIAVRAGGYSFSQPLYSFS